MAGWIFHMQPPSPPQHPSNGPPSPRYSGPTFTVAELFLPAGAYEPDDPEGCAEHHRRLAKLTTCYLAAGCDVREQFRLYGEMPWSEVVQIYAWTKLRAFPPESLVYHTTAWQQPSERSLSV